MGVCNKHRDYRESVMKFKVLVTAEIDKVGIEYLKEHGCEVLNEEGLKLQNVADFDAEYDAIITRSEKIDKAVFDKAVNLKVVAKHGIGVDTIDLESAREKGVRVVNAPEANSNSVVEHTLLLMLAIAKDLIWGDRELRFGNYPSREKLKAVEVRDKVLGLVGLGRIGRQVGLIAATGFGMKVAAYDPYVKKENIPSYITYEETLDALLENADFVSLHLPYTPSNKHLFGAEEFAKMKRSAYFINAARGPIVDETALIHALRNNIIAGAGLDVFEEEPPTRENPVFKLENVVVTPHCAALTAEAKRNMSLHAARGVVSVLYGEEPEWAVV